MYQVQCARGHWMRIPADHLGQQLLCPTCHTYVTLPATPTGQPGEPRYEYQCKHGHQLRVKAKYLGRDIRCPQCQALVTIRGKTALGLPQQVILAPPALESPAPRVSASAPDHIPVAEIDHDSAKRPTRPVHELADEEDETSFDPRAARLDRHVMRRSFGIVQTGLTTIKWSLIIGAGACVAMAIILLVGLIISLLAAGASIASGPAAQQATTPGSGFLAAAGMILSGLFLITLLCCAIAGLTGLGMQLLVPWRSGATPWALGSFLALIAVPFLAYLFVSNDWLANPNHFLLNNQRNRVTGPSFFERVLLGLLLQAIGCTPWALFMLYLRRLAAYLRKPTLRSDAMFLLMLGGALIAFLDILQILLSLLRGAPMAIGVTVYAFLLLATCVCLVLLTFKHASLLDKLRNTINRIW